MNLTEDKRLEIRREEVVQVLNDLDVMDAKAVGEKHGIHEYYVVMVRREYGEYYRHRSEHIPEVSLLKLESLLWKKLYNVLRPGVKKSTPVGDWQVRVEEFYDNPEMTRKDFAKKYDVSTTRVGQVLAKEQRRYFLRMLRELPKGQATKLIEELGALEAIREFRRIKKKGQ